MDNRSKEARSKNMSNIPSKDTKPEETVRKFLFSKGYRYRKNVSSLPGKPDIVLPKYKTVVFVNGCFWHAHKGCKWFVPPKSNIDFWNKKFEYNITRDRNNYHKLYEMGWTVLIVWECKIRHDNPQKILNDLVSEIENGKLTNEEHCSFIEL